MVVYTILHHNTEEESHSSQALQREWEPGYEETYVLHNMLHTKHKGNTLWELFIVCVMIVASLHEWAPH